MSLSPKIAILKGIVSYIPGLSYLGSTRKTGGSVSARYCYSVWLRHLVKLYEAGCFDQDGLAKNGTSAFNIVAEFGPGDSIGTGIAALLCGAKKYIALDVSRYANNERNCEILLQLVDLFNTRAPIPNEVEFAEIRPILKDYSFPHHILPDHVFAESLAKPNIDRLLSELGSLSSSNEQGAVQYLPSWNRENNNENKSVAKLNVAGSVDLIFSQAVLEHVDDLFTTYQAMYDLLAVGGVMSHQIDFRSHGITDKWNGHWGVSDLRWKITRGNRPYLLNRAPCSVHIDHMKMRGFEILAVDRTTDRSGIKTEEVAPRFKDLSEEDLITSGVIIIAKKR